MYEFIWIDIYKNSRDRYIVTDGFEHVIVVNEVSKFKFCVPFTTWDSPNRNSCSGKKFLCIYYMHRSLVKKGNGEEDKGLLWKYFLNNRENYSKYDTNPLKLLINLRF